MKRYNTGLVGLDRSRTYECIRYGLSQNGLDETTKRLIVQEFAHALNRRDMCDDPEGLINYLLLPL